jgi:ribonuclease HII
MSSFATYDIESERIALGFKYVAGVDEAGRGPAAGPVVAAAVCVPNEVLPELFLKVKDSKKLSAKRREELFPIIKEKCDVGVGIVDNNTIDEINILEATKVAMKQALYMMEYVEYALIDGTVVLKDLPFPQEQVIKGDAKSISIAAASIIAKVTRDNLMLALHKEYPIYNWAKNKAYLTKEHCEAIKLYGPCCYHRLTFGKVKEYV